jgi:hypothetical protein
MVTVAALVRTGHHSIRFRLALESEALSLTFVSERNHS